MARASLSWMSATSIGVLLVVRASPHGGTLDIALEGTVHTDVPNKFLVVLSQNQKVQTKTVKVQMKTSDFIQSLGLSYKFE
jgi:hypothetical protein